MLIIEDVRASYGHSEAIHGISLTVEKGEVVCLVGRNGAGKTSTLRAIVNDQVRITAGSIRLDGAELTGLAPHQIVRRGVGYVPEDRRVFPSLTVLENLIVPQPTTADGKNEWTIARVFELFPALDQFRSRIAGNLSGGQQQMLSIGRSLLTNPALLLLDEPHEGLAPLVTAEVIRSLKSLKAQGVAMLISEQQLHLVNECADRIYVIDKGTIVFDGTPQAFAADGTIASRYLFLAV